MRENEWNKILKEYLGTNYLLDNLFGVLKRTIKGKRMGKIFERKSRGKLSSSGVKIEGKLLKEIVFWIFIWCFEKEKRRKS